ncbi:MAG: adenosylcobinamide-GDP ribazoletransferase [Bacteroidales bacterium]|nr:adenosylcobinamide-GDP ribazoletransferase [Bacteroidales bacterium]
MFYTRIPVPGSTGFSAENLNRATRYFPLVGIIVGGAGALLFIAANLVLGVQASVLGSLLLMIMITGAFHEDGLADFCDGFGGGYSKNQILEIMKDSRIGVYGTIALILVLLSKLLLLSEIGLEDIPFVIVAAHSLSRLNPVLLIYTSRYIGSEEGSKSKPIGMKGSVTTLLVAILFSLLPLIFISWIIIPFLIVIQLLILVLFRLYVHKKTGGYTGDILGALQQLSETGFYLTFLIVKSVL